MPNTTIKCALLCALGLGALPALAVPVAAPDVGSMDIDFRSETWSGANNLGSYSVGGVTVYASGGSGTLYQDATDGFGISSGEGDEIDGDEVLIVDFGDGAWLTGLWLTDIFGGLDGFDGEDGAVRLIFGEELLLFDFNGNGAHPDNGELYVSFGSAIWATSLELLATDFRGDEFALAGFTFGAPPQTARLGVAEQLPEPGSLGLLTLGLLALGVLPRRRSRRSN